MRFSNEYGYCELNPMPGCSQIVVSNHGVIFPEFRGQGNGHKNHQLRVRRATDLGYDLMLCTVRKDNVQEHAVLIKNGWERLLEFHNSETGNDVELWSKKLDRAKRG